MSWLRNSTCILYVYVKLRVDVIVLNLNEPVTFARCLYMSAPGAWDQIDVRFNIIIACKLTELCC